MTEDIFDKIKSVVDEQKPDPFFRLKRIEELSGGYRVTCTHCHHCRR